MGDMFLEDQGFGFQLWCYYETADEWVMEGFFRSKEDTTRHLKHLRSDVETPSMPDWYVVKVEVVG